MPILEIRRLLEHGHTAEADALFSLAMHAPDSLAALTTLEGARLAEALGRVPDAIHLLERATAEQPDDLSLWLELAVLAHELEDPQRGARARAALDRLGGAAASPALLSDALVDPNPADSALGTGSAAREDRPSPTPSAQLAPFPGELESHAEEPAATSAGDSIHRAETGDLVLFARRFSGRENCYARQWWSGAGDDSGKGGYSPVREPLTLDRVRAHLAGSITVGVYPVRVDQTVTFFALDLDIRKRALEASTRSRSALQALRRLVHETGLRLLAACRDLGLPMLLEDSGYKGRHLWGFLSENLPAELVYRLGRQLLPHIELPDELTLEFFPKQAAVDSDGLGNLIKLPLGIHRRTGRRALFLDHRGVPAEDPWRHLREAPLVTRDALLAAMTCLRDARGAPSASPERPASPAPADACDDADAGADESATPAPVTPSSPATDPSCDRALAEVLAGCPVVAELLRSARATRRLDHDERVVLKHTLGHLVAGLDVVNDTFERCPEVPRNEFLVSRLRGNPISCPRIRSRVPAASARVACVCQFSQQHYPTPLLHVSGYPEALERDVQIPEPIPSNPATAAQSSADTTPHLSSPPPPPTHDLRSLLARYAQATRDVEAAERTLDRLREELVPLLAAQPGACLRSDGELWWLGVDDSGNPALRRTDAPGGIH